MRLTVQHDLAISNRLHLTFSPEPGGHVIPVIDGNIIKFPNMSYLPPGWYGALWAHGKLCNLGVSVRLRLMPLGMMRERPFDEGHMRTSTNDFLHTETSTN